MKEEELKCGLSTKNMKGQWLGPTMDYQCFQNCGPKSPTGELEEEIEKGLWVSTDSGRGGNGLGNESPYMISQIN